MMTVIHSRLLRLSFLIVCLAVSPARASQVFDLGTGFGTAGNSVPHITMLVGPADGPFASAFTPADFAAARSGPNAFYTNPNANWNDAIGLGGSWISTQGFQDGFNNNGNTALYAFDFDVIDNVIISASLSLLGGVDNSVGSTEIGFEAAGVYINGTAVSGDSVLTGGIFGGSPFGLARNDIGPLIHHGTNTLYIYQLDTGGPSGLAMGASLDVVGTLIPVPAAPWLFGAGLLGPVGFARKKSA